MIMLRSALVAGVIAMSCVGISQRADAQMRGFNHGGFSGRHDGFDHRGFGGDRFFFGFGFGGYGYGGYPYYPYYPAYYYPPYPYYPYYPPYPGYPGAYPAAAPGQAPARRARSIPRRCGRFRPSSSGEATTSAPSTVGSGRGQRRRSASTSSGTACPRMDRRLPLCGIKCRRIRRAEPTQIGPKVDQQTLSDGRHHRAI
jgi:hypothetical protein